MSYLILYIEDDRIAVEFALEHLKNDGYRIVTAPNGRAGIATAETGNPDLILLDLHLPDMTGFDIIKTLRKSEIASKAPIIMVTSIAKKEFIMTALKLGVVDYVIKPYEGDSLKKKIAFALRHGTKKREQETASSGSMELVRSGGRTSISFKENWRDFILTEAKHIFTPFLRERIKKDTVIFDLRLLKNLAPEEVKILDKFATYFEGENLHIVAGRHTGSIISNSDLENTSNLFITHGDLELFLEHSKRGGVS